MISLGTLAMTTGALYGGVKALRFWKHRERPLWLREPQLAYATVAEASLQTADHVTIDRSLVSEASVTGPAAVVHDLVYNEQGRKLSVITLTGATALIHIVLGLQGGIPLFIWNGAGFVAFLAGQYFAPELDPYRAEVRDGFIAYTGTTIVAYFLLQGSSGLRSPLGMTTKLIEAGIIGLLWHEKGTG